MICNIIKSINNIYLNGSEGDHMHTKMPHAVWSPGADPGFLEWGFICINVCVCVGLSLMIFI